MKEWSIGIVMSIGIYPSDRIDRTDVETYYWINYQKQSSGNSSSSDGGGGIG